MTPTKPQILKTVGTDKIFIVHRATGLVTAKSRCRKSADQSNVHFGTIRIEMIDQPVLSGELGEMEVVHVEVEESFPTACPAPT